MSWLLPSTVLWPTGLAGHANGNVIMAMLSWPQPLIRRNVATRRPLPLWKATIWLIITGYGDSRLPLAGAAMRYR